MDTLKLQPNIGSTMSQNNLKWGAKVNFSREKHFLHTSWETAFGIMKSTLIKTYTKMFSVNLKKSKRITRILKSPCFCELCVWCNRFSFANCNVLNKRHLWHFQDRLIIFEVWTDCSLKVPKNISYNNVNMHCKQPNMQWYNESPWQNDGKVSQIPHTDHCTIKKLFIFALQSRP